MMAAGVQANPPPSAGLAATVAASRPRYRPPDYKIGIPSPLMSALVHRACSHSCPCPPPSSKDTSSEPPGFLWGREHLLLL